MNLWRRNTALVLPETRCTAEGNSFLLLKQMRLFRNDSETHERTGAWVFAALGEHSAPPPPNTLPKINTVH
jgi:hypothetical protein